MGFDETEETRYHARAMPKMFIDGQEMEFRPGQTVLSLAHENDVDVPYFCYHPGLSIAGNCRMCLVQFENDKGEIQKKPDISCNMACKPGMKVHTQTESVKKLQSSVMEFLLLNHPLDCPVCDQAGECWLQEYYMDYARHPSAMRDHKTEKPKAVPLGPNVMLDAERCILCTRCVRFCDEVTKTSELTIVNRGGHAEISTFPSQRLENLYSSNVVDICPVGALTHRDFRFQQRVWFLKETESVCNLCSNGCNTYVDANAVDRQAYRIRPRHNDAVNAYWMCDIGRGAYKPVNAPTRSQHPVVAGAKATWDAAAGAVAAGLVGLKADAIAAVTSPYSTNENLWAFRRFVWDALKSTQVAAEVSPQAESHAKGDDFLLKADRTPNRQGLDAVFSAADSIHFDAVREGIDAGRIKALFILEADIVRLAKSPDDIRALLAKVPLVVYFATHLDETAAASKVVLPAATFVEMDGTFTNHAGRVQRIKPAFAPLYESRPSWAIAEYLATTLAPAARLTWKKAEDVFADLASRVPAFGGLTYARVGDQGALLNGAAATTQPVART